MSDKEAKELEPGVYESIFDDYPGFIRFPYPLLYAPHFQEYWDISLAPAKGLVLLDWDAHHLPWAGAKHLLVQYGDLSIKDISPGDLEADRLPLKVQQWIVGCARDYLEPELGPKVRPVALTLI
jgi:hypothetical protein